MKRKTLYAFGLSAVLGFSTLSGCGCGAVQTSESTQQETSTVEEESTSSNETIEQEETSSVAETEAVETESEIASDVTVTEETASPEEIRIIEMDATMYATTAVNERKEPSADSEKIGSLSMGEEVHVTGKTEDGLWMRIEEGDGEAFVASNYLSTEKPVVEEQPSTSEPESTSSSGGNTTQTETPAPEQTTPPEQETVVLEPAPAEEDLPPAPAPDNPDALESLPNGGSANVGGAVDFSQMTNGSGTGMGTDASGPSTGMTWQ